MQKRLNNRAGKPLLTVCVITYNHAKYIRQAIDSILAQKVSFDWEIVIADDYSTDGTRDILREYQNKYPDLITLILQKKNLGPESNWLDLIDYPKTKYVLYAEADDYFVDENKLQKQIDFLEAHKEFALVFHPVEVVNESGKKRADTYPSLEQRHGKNTLELKDLLKSNFIQTNSVMYRWRFVKESVKQVYPRGIAPGDWFLHLLHADKGKIGFIDEPMSAYRRHAGGLWSDSEKDIDKIIRKYGVAWLGFYVQALRMFCKDKESRELTKGSIITMFNRIVAVDKKYGEELLLQAIAAYPEATTLYIDDLLKQARNLQAHSEEQAKIIDHYVGLSKQLEAENRLLHGKKLVRLESSIRRHIKRNKV